MIFLASSSTRLTLLQKMIDWLICSCGGPPEQHPSAKAACGHNRQLLTECHKRQG